MDMEHTRVPGVIVGYIQLTRASKSSPKKCHFTVIIGMGPYASILNIIPISPVFIFQSFFLSITHQAVELFQAVDLHQPPSVQLTLSPGILPVVSYVRKQVLMPFLQMFK